MARRLESLFVRYRERGDVRALARVFDRAAPEVLRVAMHFARHPAEAEDLLQETFLTAIARAETFDAERRLVPWLLGIMRNHARQARRKRARMITGDDASADAMQLAAREPWMDIAWSESVRQAVESIPEPYRQVLVLRLRHDKTPSEIAVLLDIAPATVRSQIHRGLEKLRDRLSPDARPAALAVLPLGVGLAGVRERVLAQGALGATAATTTTPLVLGGLAMAKSHALTASIVLLAVVALGGAAWLGGFFDEPAGGRESASNEGTLPDRDVGHAAEPPALVGTHDGADGEPATQPEPTVAAKTEWPPVMEIPEDKGSVAGTIRFEDGTPLRDARIALWGSPNVVGQTDEKGRFHIHADWVHPRSLYLRLGRHDQPDWLGIILSTEVTMKNGKLVQRDLTLERGTDLVSTVVDASSGEPVEGVKVVLRRKPRGGGQAQAAFVMTDATGRFGIPYVPSKATYTLELEREGYEGKVEEYDLSQGSLPNELRLAKSRDLIIQFENLPEGAVDSVVSCSLSSMDRHAFSVSSKPSIRRDGSLRLDAPEPGTYRLTLFKSSHLPRLERDIVIPEGPMEPVVWTLPKGSRVVGTVLDASGDPITGAGVSIDGAAGRPKTNDEGAFEFTYVPAGRRTVKVNVGTGWIDFGKVEVPESGVGRADIRAPGASAVEGALHVGGTPGDRYSSGLKIHRVGQPGSVASARPDAAGRFRVPHLAAGAYDVYAWAGGGVAKTVRVELGVAESKSVGVIDLEAYVSVPVRIIMPGDEAVPMPVHVSAYDASKPMPERVPTFNISGTRRSRISPYIRNLEGGAKNEFQLTHLTRGRHRLEFNVKGYAAVLIDVDVQPGMKEPIEVRIE